MPKYNSHAKLRTIAARSAFGTRITGTIGKAGCDVFPDKQDGSCQPAPSPGERHGKSGPEREAALDQLCARIERLKKQAEELAAVFALKRK